MGSGNSNELYTLKYDLKHALAKCGQTKDSADSAQKFGLTKIDKEKLNKI